MAVLEPGHFVKSKEEEEKEKVERSVNEWLEEEDDGTPQIKGFARLEENK